MPVTSSERGVRTFAAEYVMLCHHYLKYKEVIDAVLGPEVIGAMEVLTAACLVVQALNQPGPK